MPRQIGLHEGGKAAGRTRCSRPRATEIAWSGAQVGLKTRVRSDCAIDEGKKLGKCRLAKVPLVERVMKLVPDFTKHLFLEVVR
jgi:hypothetical protein